MWMATHESQGGMKFKDNDLKIKIQAHMHANNESKEFPRTQGSKFQECDGNDKVIRLILHDAVIICGKKEVHVPLKKRTLVVKGDDCVSRLKVVSCMKVKKYVDRGSYLFVSHVVEMESAKRRLEDVPVICKFPDVFPDDLPRLPPPRQVEFQIQLVPEAAPVARAPYRLGKMEKLMLERIDTEGKMKKKFKEKDRHFVGLGCDNIKMDRAVRNVMLDLSGLKKDTTAAAVAVATSDIDDDDDTAPMDSQPYEPRGSPRDTQLFSIILAFVMF
nr:reverse transcriptase domain-containing protein [Tanacetum cinerariifolium]